MASWGCCQSLSVGPRDHLDGRLRAAGARPRAPCLLARVRGGKKHELMEEGNASCGLPVLTRDGPWGGGGADELALLRAASWCPREPSRFPFGPSSFLSRSPPRLDARLVVRVQTGDCSWKGVTSLLAAVLWAISSTSSTERRRAVGASAEFQPQSSRGASAATADQGHRFSTFVQNGHVSRPLSR